jgi:hypothetical protein
VAAGLRWSLGVSSKATQRDIISLAQIIRVGWVEFADVLGGSAQTRRACTSKASY